MAQTSLIPKPPPKKEWTRGFSKPGIAAKGGHNRRSYTGNLPPDLKRLRTEKIIALKINGWSHQQIATELNCSTDTIRRSINKARQEGLIEKLGLRLVKELVPAALAVVQQHLAEGSLKAAELVFKNFGKQQELKERRELAEDMARSAAPPPEDTLETFYQRYLEQQASSAVDADVVEESDDHEANSQAGADASGAAGHGDDRDEGAEEASPTDRTSPSEDRPQADETLPPDSPA